MKGYFQTLATQTGLNLSPRGMSPSADPVAPSSTQSSNVAATSGPAPFAVETVSFTSQPSEAGGESIGSDSVTNPHRDQNLFGSYADNVAVDTNAGGVAEIEDRSQSHDSIVEIRPVTLVGDSQTLSDRSEPTRFDSESAGFSAPDAAQAFRVDEIESDVISLRQPSESQFASNLDSLNRNSSQRPALSNGADAVEDTIVWDQNRTERANLSEQLQSSDQTQGRRNEEVGSYLKEVMEWIAARPDTDEDDTTSQISDAYTAITNTWGLDQTNETYIASRSDQTRDPDIQDLNLSIGTISIVVEDPSGHESLAPALPAAPIQTQSAPSSAASHEPTNLSRYYLRSW